MRGGREGWKGALSLGSTLFPFSHSFKKRRKRRISRLRVYEQYVKANVPPVPPPPPSLQAPFSFPYSPFSLTSTFPSFYLSTLPSITPPQRFPLPPPGLHPRPRPPRAPYPITRPLAHGQHNNRASPYRLWWPPR